MRIRNVSKEYKLVAEVFSPDLLRIELRQPDPISPYQSATSTQLVSSEKARSQSHLNKLKIKGLPLSSQSGSLRKLSPTQDLKSESVSAMD